MSELNRFLKAGSRERLEKNFVKFVWCFFMLPFFVQAQSGNRPNVVLILADDLGYTDISHYGSEKIGRASCRERV